jgi:hypothetical protein
MGSTSYSASFYADRSAMRASVGVAGKSTLHTAAVVAGTAPALADRLDPKRLVKSGPMAGKNVREARDSDVHPLSRGVIVMFDVTGSMSTIPAVLQTKLNGLHAMLVKKDYVQDASLMMAAIGDATCDRVPLQVGNFESGNEMDEDLDHIYLEGGGGGQKTESYELGMYYMARHTAMDCWEKRGQKGYLFMIGDEMPYPAVRRNDVEQHIGDKLQENISLDTIVEELKEKFEVFFIIPRGASHGADSEVKQRWVSLFGQNVLMLDNPDDVCECIAGAIGLCEGKVGLDDMKVDLKDVGTDTGTIAAVSNALAGYASSRDLVATGAASGTLATVPDDDLDDVDAAGVKRL